MAVRRHVFNQLTLSEIEFIRRSVHMDDGAKRRDLYRELGCEGCDADEKVVGRKVVALLKRDDAMLLVAAERAAADTEVLRALKAERDARTERLVTEEFARQHFLEVLVLAAEKEMVTDDPSLTALAKGAEAVMKLSKTGDIDAGLSAEEAAAIAAKQRLAAAPSSDAKRDADVVERLQDAPEAGTA